MARGPGSTALCLGLLLAAGVQGAAAGNRGQKNSPVTKVVTLLKDMVAQLEKEAKEDEEVYETTGCWCETNDREKTKAIADAKVKIERLNSEIEKNDALASQMTTDVATLQEEIAK